MKTTKLSELNPIILDAFDTAIEKNYYAGSTNTVEEFNHFNYFLLQLAICNDTWDSTLSPIRKWEPEQKLVLISLLAIMSDEELEELFGIVAKGETE